MYFNKILTGNSKQRSLQKWAGLLIAVGIVIRLIQLLADRALWYDEALLAKNIIDRSFEELTAVLDYNQAAPIGFLWLEKLSIIVLGESELSLRLFPFLAGIACLLLFYQIIRKIFAGPVLLLALSFFLFNDQLIYHSGEVKQYIFDVTTLLLLHILTTNVIEDHAGPKKLLGFGLWCGLLCWFSQPIIFGITASFAILAWHFYREYKSRSFVWLFLAALIAFGSFALNYFGFVRHTIANQNLQTYHAPDFMPVAFWEKESLQWYAENYFDLFRNPGGMLFKYLAGAVGLLGLIRGLRTVPVPVLLLLLPLCLAFGASSLQLYSTVPRLLLFGAPGIIIIVVLGLEWLIQLSKAKRPMLGYAGWGVAFLLLLQPFLDSVIHNVADPIKVEEIKPCLALISEQAQAGDILYVFGDALPQFAYYEKKYVPDDLVIIRGISPHLNWKEELSQLKGEKRVWLLFSHYIAPDGTNFKELYIQHFQNIAQPTLRYEAVRSACYLFEPRE